MKISLMDTTKTLLQEISNIEMNKKDVTITYKLALQSSETTNWKIVNMAIINRWGKKGLKEIKKRIYA